MLFLPLVDDVYSQRRERTCQQIIPVEWFCKTSAGSDGSDDRNQRIPDGYLSYRIAAQQLVIERKTDRGNADKQQEVEASEHVDVR